MKDKNSNIITTIANIFNRIYDLAIIPGIVLFFLGKVDIAFYIFLYGGSLYLLSLCLKMIANEKKNKKITFLGIILTIIFVIITIFNIFMSIKWIGR